MRDSSMHSNRSAPQDDRRLTSEFWDAHTERPQSLYWAEYPIVRRYVNTLVTDAWWAYPTHGFKAGWAYAPLARGLSLGCGSGLLEKDLRWLRICESVDAFDISPRAIAAAMARAASDGIDGVRYEVADCERYDYAENHYDAVFFHGSMHHMSDPAALLDRVLPALTPGGLLFLDDYVGPSRDEWNAAHLAEVNRVYAELPAKWRTVPLIEAPFDFSDPSEMVASSAILPAVRERFDILWERPYWGNLLFPLLCQVDQAAAAAPAAESTLQWLIDRERALVAAGTYRQPLFTWIVGRKKPGR